MGTAERSTSLQMLIKTRKQDDTDNLSIMAVPSLDYFPVLQRSIFGQMRVELVRKACLVK